MKTNTKTNTKTKTKTTAAFSALACKAVLVLVLVAVAGCVTELDPGVGERLASSCNPVDSDIGRTTSFTADIQPILERCQKCHSPLGQNPIGLHVSGLDLSSYASLRAGGTISGADILVEGNPCASILLQKVGPAPPFGDRMPLDGPPFLTSRELELLHDWVAEGGADD